MTTAVDVSNLESRFREYAIDGGVPDDKFYHVNVGVPDATGNMASIELDGVRMKGVVGYVVDVAMNAATKVTVTFIAASVNESGSAS